VEPEWNNKSTKVNIIAGCRLDNASKRVTYSFRLLSFAPRNSSHTLMIGSAGYSSFITALGFAVAAVVARKVSLGVAPPIPLWWLTTPTAPAHYEEKNHPSVS
jgi:hypothetical protein